MSNTDISKYSRVSKDILQTHLLSYFNSLYLKLLVSQSKLSWTRKGTWKYQLSEMNFDFEISRVDCRRQKYSFSVYSVDHPLTNTRRSSYRRTALNSYMKDMTQHGVIAIHSKGIFISPSI